MPRNYGRRRTRMGRKKSRRTFRRGAQRQHRMNRLSHHNMRGGIRL